MKTTLNIKVSICTFRVWELIGQTTISALIPLITTARKRHRKTRSGCKTCKRRKIKYDKNKPSGGNCLRHNITCSYSIDLQDVPDLSDNHLKTPSRQHSSTPSGPTNELFVNSEYLKLLHHFTTVTSYTISGNSQLRTLWRVDIP